MNGTSNRLDMELVSRGLCSSRAKAQALIQEGQVQVDGIPARKANQKVWPETNLHVDVPETEWVGRGAYKLLAALEHFKPDIDGRIAADIGASTGGFSQVLLHHNARKVYAIDVGHDQLHESLEADARLINMEGVNARYLTSDLVPDLLDMVVTDASFISLKKLLPAALALCAPDAFLIALVKPQFEVGKGNLGKGGIVRNLDQAEGVRTDMENWMNAIPGWRCLGSIVSPITGSDGNREYLMGAICDAGS